MPIINNPEAGKYANVSKQRLEFEENLISTSFLIPILRKWVRLKKLWGKMGMNKT